MGDDMLRERRVGALRAVRAVASDLGLGSLRPRILKDSNNTVIHLFPLPLVAKVAATPIRARAAELLERELEVGLHLAKRGAPIAPPASTVSPGPHRHERLVVTLWEFLEHDPQRELPPHSLAEALRALHGALADYPGQLPSFTSHLDHVGVVLADPASLPSLAASDRRFLQGVHEVLSKEVSRFTFDSRPLHGGPHLDGNVLRSKSGPRFVDLEAACIGPLEWDLAYLPSDVAATFSDVNEDLLDALGAITSLCVATWCWMQPQRAPEVAEAATFHLAALRRRFAHNPQLVLNSAE